MDISIVNRFAEDAGYGSARLIGDWRQFVVYEAIPKDRTTQFDYLPNLILVAAGKIEFADFILSTEFVETYGKDE